MAYHVPALLEESIDGLAIRPEGTYVDVTFGGGGHSEAILSQLTTGRLLAFDQDADAKANADRLLAGKQDRSFTFIEANFRYLKRYLKFHGISAVDGILADLGVSFHQFDTANRGFSTRFDGDLDMRMNRSTGISASEMLNVISEKDLIHLLSSLGEIRNARTLAQKIISTRSQTPITTSLALK
ncbi:MAG: 16S rRNA (cytosine(1402)-N(4))-methyltransferase RsmH, partial [Bacteroidota bacterium]